MPFSYISGVSISPEAGLEIEKIAEQRKVSRSQVIREAIEFYITSKKEAESESIGQV
jgi:metal-responsive CopG/Arc/MetJ family transcriptional regulator